MEPVGILWKVNPETKEAHISKSGLPMTFCGMLHSDTRHWKYVEDKKVHKEDHCPTCCQNTR